MYYVLLSIKCIVKPRILPAKKTRDKENKIKWSAADKWKAHEEIKTADKSYWS